MSDGATMQLADEKAQISLRLPSQLHEAIITRARESGMSVNRTAIQFLRSGIEAQQQKKQHLAELLERYRESKNPEEVQRLSDELGVMIFGQ